MRTSLQISSASLSVTSDVINLDEEEDLLMAAAAAAGVRIARFLTGIFVPGGGLVGEHGAGA